MFPLSVDVCVTHVIASELIKEPGNADLNKTRGDAASVCLMGGSSRIKVLAPVWLRVFCPNEMTPHFEITKDLTDFYSQTMRRTLWDAPSS